MEAIELGLFLAVIAATWWWVGAPLRGGDAAASPGELAALEAERDVRLDAVRDAELDLQTGKLTTADHRALDAELRAEALAALRRLDAARAEGDGR
jgi:hypothetical protein